jgi:hypothetical protein
MSRTNPLLVMRQSERVCCGEWVFRQLPTRGKTRFNFERFPTKPTIGQQRAAAGA